MQPTNRSERRRALLNFMLLFLLCTAIIVTTVFTSIKVPFSQNEVLLRDKKNTENRISLQKAITDKMFAISLSIDSLDNKKISDFTQLDISMGNEIRLLSEMAVNAEGEDKRLYSNIVTNLTSYYAAKKSAQLRTGDNTDQSKLNDKIEALQRDRDEYKEKFFNCLNASLKK